MEHALTIRVLGLTMLVLAVGAGATTYLGAQGKKQDERAQTNVRVAVQAVTAWYQDPFGGHGSYRRLDTQALVREAPVVSSKVRAFPLAGGQAYCLADVEASGHSAYFVGGDTDAVPELRGAVAERVTLDHETGSNASPSARECRSPRHPSNEGRTAAGARRYAKKCFVRSPTGSPRRRAAFRSSSS